MKCTDNMARTNARRANLIPERLIRDELISSPIELPTVASVFSEEPVDDIML